MIKTNTYAAFTLADSIFYKRSGDKCYLCCSAASCSLVRPSPHPHPAPPRPGGEVGGVAKVSNT